MSSPDVEQLTIVLSVIVSSTSLLADTAPPCVLATQSSCTCEA